MTIKQYFDLIQHTDEWRQARCGLLTASEMECIITPAKLTVANNKDSRAHLTELAAQRVNQYVEPTWFGGDMERGIVDEIDAKALYRQHYAAVMDCGFITNDKWGFTIGYSPDGLVEIQTGVVETPGQIEVKSRAQKYQMQTILADSMPVDYLIQVQTGLLVTERAWCDFISYCSGMPMLTLRVHADPQVQEAILTAAQVFDTSLNAIMQQYQEKLIDGKQRLIPTERKVIDDDFKPKDEED